MSRLAKRSWKGYILEFVMLFLAVSLGFMADKLRDKASEDKKEMEYIQSMIEDVEEDRVNIRKVIEINMQKVLSLDSLSNLCFDYHGKDEDKLDLNRHFIAVLYHPEFFTSTELTMQQLKNAGGMRLIKSKKAINEIIRYDTKLKEIANQQLYYENYQNKAIDIGTDIFNINELLDIIRHQQGGLESTKLDLLNDDNIKLKKFGNSVTMYKGIIEYYATLLSELDDQGRDLQQTLERVYEME